MITNCSNDYIIGSSVTEVGPEGPRPYHQLGYIIWANPATDDMRLSNFACLFVCPGGHP